MNINNPYPLQLFVFGNDLELGEAIAELLKIKPSSATTRMFPDGERLPHQQETVRDRDVFIIFTSQNGEEIDKNLIDYLRFVRSVRAGQPQKITVILPKLPHQRQDLENRKLRQPKMVSLFPELFKTAGADRIIVCKLHNPASQTENPPMENIDSTLLIVTAIKEKFSDLTTIAIAAADLGGSKYAREIADELGVATIIVEKSRHTKTGLSKAMKVYTEGEISSSIDTIVFVDDIISTFNTLADAADALHKEYPQIKDYIAFATHGDFGSSTLSNIVRSRFSSIFITDTVPVPQKFVSQVAEAGKEMIVISIAKLIAQAIDNLHNGKSISSLWVMKKE